MEEGVDDELSESHHRTESISNGGYYKLQTGELGHFDMRNSTRLAASAVLNEAGGTKVAYL